MTSTDVSVTGQVQPRRAHRGQAQLVPVHVEGTLSPESQRAAVRAFASLITDMLLDDPALCPMDTDPIDMGEDPETRGATMEAGGSR